MLRAMEKMPANAGIFYAYSTERYSYIDVQDCG